MSYVKFDIAKLERLNDPGRFDTLKPAAMWVALGEPTPRTIVEIGAGTGLFSAAFSKRAPGATVYAVDVEPVMIERMQKHRSEVASGRIVPVLAEETHVPLEDGVADLVVMINLHHELVDPAASYAEAYRLLAAGGQLLVVDWAHADTPKGPPLAVRATRQQLEQYLSAAGFSRVAVHDVLDWHELLTAWRD